VIQKPVEQAAAVPRGTAAAGELCGFRPVREARLHGRFGHTKCYDDINEGKIVA
jgi:hypothetical protein